MSNLETFDALLENKVAGVGGVLVVGNNAASVTDGIDLQVAPFNQYNDSNKNTFECVFNFATLVLGGGTVSVSLEVDSVSNFAAPVTVAGPTPVPAGSTRIVLIADGDTIKRMKAGARYIRTRVAGAGQTAGSASYRSFFRKPRGMAY